LSSRDSPAKRTISFAALNNRAMSLNTSAVKDPNEPPSKDSAPNLNLKMKCTGGCHRELENESEANICAGPCGLTFCPECAYDQGTHCQECGNFSCHACWDTISDNGCPFCDQWSDSVEREEEDNSNVASTEDDATKKHEDVESANSTRPRKLQKREE